MNTGFHFEEGTALIIVEGQDIFIILALMAAAIALEIFLGVKKDGRLGLVLPGLMLLRSVVKLIVWMIQVSAYSSVSAMGGELCMAVLVENVRLCKRWKTVQQLKKSRIQDL